MCPSVDVITVYGSFFFLNLNKQKAERLSSLTKVKLPGKGTLRFDLRPLGSKSVNLTIMKQGEALR